MSRSVSPPRGRLTALVAAGLLALGSSAVGPLAFGPTAARAAPAGTPGPEPTPVGGPRVAAQAGRVVTPVLDVAAPALDVFVVSGNAAGDSLEAESTGRIELTLGADVLFAFGRAELTPAANQRLAEIADRIRRQAKGPVRIDGHTDSIGAVDDNQRLSQRRAETVRAALAARLADRPVTFQVSGHGESEPVADNSTPDGGDNPAGRARNRRVEIRFDK